MLDAEVVQSVLAPAGPHAATIRQLWSLMLWTTTVVFVVTIGMVAAAVVRGRRARARNGHPPNVSAARNLHRSIAAAGVATVITLFVLLVASIVAGRTIARAQSVPGLTIAITGHQWWWEIEYEDSMPYRRVTTANELHIPVGQPVVLKVTSRDVIHSLWVPNLQGKRDLIPGYTTAIPMQADHEGTFRGQCAEFCGLQHAHMAVTVVAESRSDLDRWLDRQRQNAPPPAADDVQRGQSVFMSNKCAGCHTIRGTDAAGRAGPDLTHVATRRTIAAGTLPNTPEHMRRWIADPQLSKPGTQMPAHHLPNDALDDLVRYLETLI